MPNNIELSPEPINYIGMHHLHPNNIQNFIRIRPNLDSNEIVNYIPSFQNVHQSNHTPPPRYSRINQHPSATHPIHHTNVHSSNYMNNPPPYTNTNRRRYEALHRRNIHNSDLYSNNNNNQPQQQHNDTTHDLRIMDGYFPLVPINRHQQSHHHLNHCPQDLFHLRLHHHR